MWSSLALDKNLLRLLVGSLAASSLLALGACAASPPDDVELDDDGDLDLGKADTAGLSEGSAAALGVLRVANELSATQLRSDAGLTTTASQNIALYRIGDDEAPGTSDDERFDTLAELDAVPSVGPVAFQRLLAYATARGYVATDADPSCTGPALMSADVLPLFAPGTTSTYFGAYQLTGRSRLCTNATGCAAWASDHSAIAPNATMGLTTLDVIDDDGNVGISFLRLPQQAWLSRVPLTSQPTASAMSGLLSSPSGFAFTATPIRETCASMKATKTEPVDALTRRETEITLRATHSADPELASYFTQARDVAFTCKTHRWDYQWTCQGRTESNGTGTGVGTLTVAPGGGGLTFHGKDGLASYTSSFNKTYPLDARGSVSTTEGGGSTTMSFRASVFGRAMLVGFTYSWTSSANWCGASTHFDFQCDGVLIAP